MTNIFREAKQLLDKKDNGDELTEKEFKLVSNAIFPLLILPEYNDTPIAEGLEELAQLISGAMVAGSRGGAVAARQGHNLKVVGSNPTPATKRREG